LGFINAGGNGYNGHLLLSNKVTAETAPIEVGDLLTTADIAGHAMKATDLRDAFGSVIGKALRPLAAGRGLIPILIALQ
jgi:hypothetical protein